MSSPERQLERYRRGLIATVRDVNAQAAFDFEDPEWREDAERAIEELAASGFAFTAEDVRARVGSPHSSGAMGAAFRQAARRHLIRRVGYVLARRIERHGSVVAQWIGTGKNRAASHGFDAFLGEREREAAMTGRAGQKLSGSHTKIAILAAPVPRSPRSKQFSGAR